MSKCELCGEYMPRGEEMFKYHGYSGPCPEKPTRDAIKILKKRYITTPERAASLEAEREIAALEARVKELELALSWYADRRNWCQGERNILCTNHKEYSEDELGGMGEGHSGWSCAEIDEGKKARQALANKDAEGKEVKG